MASSAPSSSFWWWKLLTPYRGTLASGLAATMLCGGAAALAPYWAGRAVHALEQHDFAQSRHALLWMLLVTAIAGIGRYLMRKILIGLSRNIERNQRESFYAFLLTRSFAFHERNRVADLMSRVGDDVNTVRMATGPGLMSFLQTFSILPVTLLLMIHTSPRLTLVLMAPFTLLALTFYALGRLSHATQQRIQVVTSQLNTFSHETISGASLVQAFGIEDLRVSAFHALSQQQAKLNIRQTLVYGMYMPTSALVSALAALLLVGYGGHLVLQKSLGLGDLTAFIGYLAALTWPIMSLGWAANLFQRGRAGQERIDAILDSPEALPSVDHLITGAHPPVSLRLEKVCHRFESGRGLGPIDLEIPAGGSLAVVGGIGSGKTVLLQILAALREPQSGGLFVDGQRITPETLRTYWHGLGWVPQEAFLFGTTLRENLMMGRPEASDEEIAEVVRIVTLDDLVTRLPEGLNTVVGERGVILSGGERQRTALARALLRKPRLLLLDDCLSAVDTETESRILANLKTHLGESTLVLATHRISVAALCDQVLVLEEGVPVQYGSPADLAAQTGTFARFKRLQSLESV